MNTYGKLKKIFCAALTAALSLTLAAVTVLFGGCETEGENKIEYTYNVNEDGLGDTSGDRTDGGDSSAEEESGEISGLVIPLSDVTATAKFYGVTVGDTYMEVIAVKYGSTYRTAFNTCQVCYGSPKAYFVQSGNYLVCQTCGSKFSMAQLGATTGSCNPYPITSSDRVTTADSIIIPDSFLITCKYLFKTWKSV